jgi:hypothetical protein
MEYENVFALGPLCGVSDADTVIEASSRCDALGLDTISTGGTIAWAMECAERGLIDLPWLRFGDGAALIRAIESIGAREGIGDLLAEGSRSASRLVGQGSEAFAAHVKGLELPVYEPRTLQAMALGLAVNARGADHNRSGAYEADLSGRHDRLAGGEPHVAGAIETEDRAANASAPRPAGHRRLLGTQAHVHQAPGRSASTGSARPPALPAVQGQGLRTATYQPGMDARAPTSLRAGRSASPGRRGTGAARSRCGR